MFYKKWLVNFTSLNCNLKNGPKLSHFGRAKLRRSKNGSVSAEQPCCRPNQAIFPLNIDSGFIVNAPVTSNTAALSIYSLWIKIEWNSLNILYISQIRPIVYCGFFREILITRAWAKKHSENVERRLLYSRQDCCEIVIAI